MSLLCFAQEMLLQRCFAVSLLATVLLGLGVSATPSAQGDVVLQASSGGVLLAGQSLPQVRVLAPAKPIGICASQLPKSECPSWYAVMCWMRRCDQLQSVITSAIGGWIQSCLLASQLGHAKPASTDPIMKIGT